MYEIMFTSQASKDIEKIKKSKFEHKTIKILEILKNNPYQNPPPYEKLIGCLNGAYSRRINIKHRLVYRVLEEKRVVEILRMWSHYE